MDLIKFYADWFYSPVDEELENKMYFLETENDKIQNYNNYYYENLKKLYIETKKDCGISKI